MQSEREFMPQGSYSLPTCSIGAYPVSEDTRSLCVTKLVEWLGLKGVEENGDLKETVLRAQGLAVKTLLDMDRFNLQVDIERDRRSRLDQGQPTQIVGSLSDLKAEVDNLLDEIGPESGLESGGVGVSEEDSGSSYLGLEEP